MDFPCLHTLHSEMLPLVSIHVLMKLYCPDLLTSNGHGHSQARGGWSLVF